MERLNLTADYWQSLTITLRDIEFLQTHLFETETPLTPPELAAVLVQERIRNEQAVAAQERLAAGKIYLPKENYAVGEALVFPALDWKRGVVAGVRPGKNPEIGNFDVIEVDFNGNGMRYFAAGLADHKLNTPPEVEPDESLDPSAVIETNGAEIEAKLESTLAQDDNLVKIAGRWFPRALLVDVNTGHLNLAEAVLEMSGGQPMTTSALAGQIELPSKENPKLVEFSLNYALQEDERFDEVGPAGQVLWVLRRLEPEEVRNTPTYLQYQAAGYDRSVLSKQMLAFETELDDELSDVNPHQPKTDDITITLTYPHWRAGTLPRSNRLRPFFPTAYESPRVCFTLVDGRTGEKIPAWLVRKDRYVSGLKAWYEKNKLIPGALINIRRSKTPGEVIIEARTRRPTKDWVRTVLAGSDGGLVFALIKQEVACEFNERMVIAVPDVKAVDAAWDQNAKGRQSFEQLVAAMIRELSKLTPQGHVHAQELYSAVNMLRRCPPGPLLSLLVTNAAFKHVGDLYYRLNDNTDEEA